jgi:hypothetical protein
MGAPYIYDISHLRVKAITLIKTGNNKKDRQSSFSLSV